MRSRSQRESCMARINHYWISSTSVIFVNHINMEPRLFIPEDIWKLNMNSDFTNWIFPYCFRLISSCVLMLYCSLKCQQPKPYLCISEFNLWICLNSSILETETCFLATYLYMHNHWIYEMDIYFYNCC